MALVVTPLHKSLAVVDYVYNVTGLVTGANAIVLPAPPAAGSFPPAADWTPTVILCFPYQSGAVGNVVTPDYSTIVNTAGAITFTLYAAGATNVLIFVY
jgi:hypothetical protein